MRNEYFFQFDVTQDQLEYARQLVDYSIKSHPVADIFQNDPQGKERQREYRLTGTLGEVVFADAYSLRRPTRSFGAIDGQDFGQDFIVPLRGTDLSFDIKSMGRKNNQFRENYVLNLPKYQMDRPQTITDFYFCVSFHKNNEAYVASFIGYVSKQEIQNGKLGILYKSGTKRLKDDGGYFVFQRDTYEVFFKDISTPFLNEKVAAFPGFKKKNILPPYVRV